MKLGFEELSPHRGAFVEIDARFRDCLHWVRGREEQEWKPWGDQVTRSGILSMSREGVPMLDGTCLAHFMKECEIFAVRELFRPAKNALRFICRKCQQGHPLSLAIEAARIECDRTFAKAKPCSLCGGTREERYVTPSKFLKFSSDTPHEEIEKELVSYVFATKMGDWNATAYLDHVERCRVSWRKKEGAKFEYHWRAEGRFIVSYCESAPAAGLWHRWVDMKEIKEMSLSIYINHQLFYERVRAA